MSWWLTSFQSAWLSSKNPSVIWKSTFSLPHHPPEEHDDALASPQLQAWSFFLLIKVSSQIQRIELYPHHTSHCLYGVMLFYHFNRTLMPFPICKGSNVCVLVFPTHRWACLYSELWQMWAEARKLVESGFDSIFGFFPSEVIYIRMFLFVLRETFCMLLIPNLWFCIDPLLCRTAARFDTS